jgi:hypothetical protein
VIVEHGYFSSRRVVTVDGHIVVDVPATWSRLWNVPTEHPFRIGMHDCVVRIWPRRWTYGFDVIVDGRSVTTGGPPGPMPAPVWPQPSPEALESLPEGRREVIPMGVAMAGLVFLLTFAFLFCRVAPERGPRWLAGTGLVIDIGVVILMVGAGGMFLLRRRESIAMRVFGAVALAVGLLVISQAPADVADAFDPFTTRDVLAATWRYDRSNRTPEVLTASGEVLRWAENYASVEYPRRPPGAYRLTLTARNSRVVDAIPIGP